MYLIEPGLNITLPLFMEVSIRNHVIPFGRHGETVETIRKLLLNIQKEYDLNYKTDLKIPK